MSKTKSIDLGNGLQKETSYTELKALLKDEIENTDSKRRKVALNTLRVKFPAEFEAEREVERLENIQNLNKRRWGQYLDLNSSDPSLVPYWITHEDLLKRISRSNLVPRKNKPKNWVTTFTGWIFEVIHGPSDPAKKAAGKEAERNIEKSRIKKNRPLSSNETDWQLIDKDPLNNKPHALEISQLKVGNESLYGAPDYVFFNHKKSTIVIVEVKFTFTERPLPLDGWPNLRAQLWAYGSIDKYLKKARNIILIGEIWGHYYSKDRSKEGYAILHTYRWNMSDVEFCKKNEELFASYRKWAEGTGASIN